jgi:hypothetical protein
MHLRTFPDHQKHFFNKEFFDLQECLKMCFDAFAHTSRPPETFFKKDIVYRLEWLKMCFNAFAHISRPPETFLQKRFFMHLRKFPDHQNHFFKKDFFNHQEWLNTCFDAVPRMSALFFHRPPIYERATDHKYTKGCSHLGKKRGWDQV